MPPRTDSRYRQIIVSNDDRASGETSYDKIQAGVEEFNDKGFIVLQNAISHETLDKLAAQMHKDVETCLGNPDLVYNGGEQMSNFSISPPVSRKYLDRELWANPHLLAIMESIIGPKPQLCFASSNINLANVRTGRQAVHCDSYTKQMSFPTCLEVFLFLDDVDIKNGSTEIWPGTHKGWNVEDQISHGRGWIRNSVFTKRAKKSPPFQPYIPKGSICMRDIRIWHAGMPNNSKKDRIMVVFIWFPRWFRSPMRLTLPEDCRTLVESWENVDLVGATNFVDGEVNYLDSSMMYTQLNFTQDPELGIKRIRADIDRIQGRREPRISITKRNYWTAPKRKKAELPESPTRIQFPRKVKRTSIVDR